MSESINLFLESQIKLSNEYFSVKMKNEVVSERSQIRARAGLGVNGMIQWDNRQIYL